MREAAVPARAHGGLEARGASGPFSVDVETDRVRVRYQQARPFALDHPADRLLIAMVLRAPSAPDSQGDGGACRSGGFLVAAPNAPMTVRQDREMEVLTLSFDAATLPQANWADAATPPAACSEMRDPAIRNLAAEVRRAMVAASGPDDDYVDALARALLLRLRQLVAASRDPSAIASLRPSRLRQVLRHIDERLADRLTVKDLAALAGVSRSHFSRAFRQATGQPPHRYILARRLERVRSLLGDPELELATIALRSGFSSHAHMTSSFTRAFGFTPSALRNPQPTDGDPAAGDD